MAVPIEDCCGLGCNNCILDRFIDCCGRNPLTSNENIINLFNSKDYQTFSVKNITKERPFVYQFTFQLKRDQVGGFEKYEQLLAPPVSYLMLRACRGSDGTVNSLFDDFDSEFDFKEEKDNLRLFRTQTSLHDKGTPEIYFSRKYTPYEVNEELRTFKIIVKLEPSGRMSRFLTTLKVGTVCEFKGPFEAFRYKHEAIENYIVVTQGISIVSAFRLVKEIIYESAQTRILVISCFKNINETFLREDFFKLSLYWCLKHHMFLSQQVEPELPPRSGEKFHNERLDSENFKELMKELRHFDPKETQVLISGRESFIENATKIVKEGGYKKISPI